MDSEVHPIHAAPPPPCSTGAAAVQPWPDAELRDRVHQLLLGNVMQGWSPALHEHYCYVAPSLGKYPYQWFWDSCFHVMMLAHLGEAALARRCLRSLFAMQEDNGFVGHMIYWHRPWPMHLANLIESRPSSREWQPHMSALIQPPVAAQALLALFRADGDRAFLDEMYAKVKRQHAWLAANRDFDGDGLLSIISNFESGMDFKPSYDAVLGHVPRTTPTGRRRHSRLFWNVMAVEASNFSLGYDLPRIRARGRFVVKDAGFNTMYACDLQALETLAGLAGDDPAPFAARRARVARAMLERMYDPQRAAFLDVQEPGGAPLPVLTPTIFFPLALDLVPDEIARAVVERHLQPGGAFDARWPLPSVDLRDPAFFRGWTPFLWRGPTWAYVNWFLARAFAARGMHPLTQRLRDALAGLLARSGFREYYDPVTGDGHGAEGFTWGGLLVVP